MLVTGATRGLGLEIARGMAAAGAAVGINGRDPARADEVASEHSERLSRSLRHHRSARRRRRRSTRSWRGTAASTASSTTRPCATAGPCEDITAEDFRRLLETNLVAQYELSRVAARHMAARGQGRLVFITSMVGPQSFQGDPAYVASKGGLEALMRALAVELGPKGIAANAIAPGFFLTEVNAPFFAQPRIVELARRIPLQRFGRPDELVGAAIFLASDAASYITGQVLTVDAGLSVAL